MKNAVTKLSFIPSAALAALMLVLQVGDGENASAQSPEPSVTQNAPSISLESFKLLANYIESGGDYFQLDNNYGSWAGGYARTAVQAGKDVLNGEVSGQREFGDKGVYLAAGDTHTFSENWYASLTAASSIKGFFWPRYRTDAFLNRKLLSRKQLVATIGYGYYAAKDEHRNQSAYVGSTYYFAKPWVIEEGLYLNVSNPGAVFAPAGFIAMTEGANKHHYLTLRVGLGEEGYQLVGSEATLAKFESQTVTGTWRRWLGKSWGINLVGDYYRNPYYSRGGSTLGFFKDF